MKEWYLVHRNGKRMSPIAQAFHDFVLNESGQVVALPQPRPASKARRGATHS
jgi:hypothetical protein